MIKLLYLLAGISLKQTVDEFKALFQRYVDNLEKRKEDTATYRPTPALLQGSPEAHSFMCEAEHRNRVAPEVKKLRKRIFIVRLLPFFAYLILTLSFISVIVYLESTAEVAE